MKITDYPSVVSLVENNVFVIDGPEGTKQITAKDLAGALCYILGSDGYYDFLDEILPVEERRNTFRGKNLGPALTTEQAKHIADGSFKGFFIGDYWEIGGRIWRIVDIDYWLGTGDEECTTHHLVIMPDEQLYTARMNSNDTTNGGYMSSEMYTTNLENAKSLVYSAFGETYILEHKEYLTNSVTDGHASGVAWINSKVELPNEIQMYGSYVFAASGDGKFVSSLYTIDKTQLALMKVYPRFINPARQNQWLRDVASASAFVLVYSGGTATYGNASHPYGVRPVFGIIGGDS